MSHGSHVKPGPGPAGAGRNLYIDTLRGWSIFGVVCVHFAGSFVTTDTFAWSPSFYLGLTLNQVFSFAVPMFVFLSGLLAGASRAPVTLGDYYRGRFWRIAFPYLIASFAAFFLLNHHAEWLALPGYRARFIWLFQRICFYGVEPTLYFIPLILQLYVLQPALKALPGWLNQLLPAFRLVHFALVLTALLLALHLAIGVKCNRGTLDYYTWARPNAVFWMVYFFAGLHFRTLTGMISVPVLRTGGQIALLAAVGAMVWNGYHLTDRSFVGTHFELNRLDFAYVRPEMLVYDLAVVVGLAAGVALGWAPGATVLTYLGRYTLEIYLWHIMVLYFGAWRYADALASCRQMPELIVILCAATCLVIAGVADGLSRLTTFVQHHRLVLVKTP